MTVLESRAIHASINRPWMDVYAFVANPNNMPLWASGLGSGLVQHGEFWLADGGPIGKVKVSFTPENEFGIVDHWVEMPSGLRVYNAFRVVQNLDGAEAIFLVTRLPGMSLEQFEKDAAHVHKDLLALKHLLEGELSP